MEGRVAAIAVKPAHRAPMERVDSVEVTVEDGIVGNVRQTARRRVTFLSAERWAEVQEALGTELGWETRRANILVEGLVVTELIGKRMRVGDVEVEINGETEPCSRMDEALAGLKDALAPRCGGGVYGNVRQGGTIRVGDTIRVESGSELVEG